MKKSTKFTSLLLSALMVGSSFAGLTVINASAADEQKVYFQYPTDGTWGDASAVKVNSRSGLANVYCYAYSIYGNETKFTEPAWEARSTQCTAEGNDVYSFDLSAYGVVEEGADYGIIFSTANGAGYQTCDMTMTSDCIGDTIIITGETRENAADSKKTDYLAKWAKNDGVCGYKANITSLGNYVDGYFPAHQPKAQQLSNSLKSYLTNPTNVAYFQWEVSDNKTGGNKVLCELLGVTPREVYDQYISDNAENIEGAEVITPDGVTDKTPVKYINYIGVNDKGVETTLKMAAPEEVAKVLNLEYPVVDPTTEPETEPETTEPETEPETTEPETEPETTEPETEPTTEPETTEPETEPTTEPETTEPETEPTTEPVEETVYSLAGQPEAIFGALWNAENTTTDLTKGEDGLYSITFNEVAPYENAEFKVVVNHAWDEAYPEQNFVFSVTDTCDVTVTFNAETKEINVTGEYVVIPQDLEIEVMRAVGNGEGTWLNGIAWDPDADENAMDEVADGIYEISFEDVPAFDNWQIKFAANGGWANNWGLAEGEVYTVGETVEATFNGENITLEVEEDGSTVKAQIDVRDFDYTTKKGAKITITVTAPEVPETTEPETTEPETEPTTEPVEETVYSLAGQPEAIFGALWNAENTTTELTKGEDGLYSITFNEVAPYENAEFKVVVNHAWDEAYPEQNFVFSVTDVCDVTVTFNAETKEINVTGEYVVIPQDLEIEVMRAVGNGEDTWLNGIAWDPDADENAMEEVADGIYEISFEDVPAFDNWQIKFAANGGWANNWGLAEGEVYTVGETVEATFNGENIIFEVEEDGSTVKAQIDVRDFDYTTKKGAKITITVTAPEVPETTEPETEPETTEPKTTVLIGDANLDGVITVDDATLVQKAGIDLVTLDGNAVVAADVNGDGRISILDVTCIQKYLANITDGAENAGKEVVVD